MALQSSEPDTTQTWVVLRPATQLHPTRSFDGAALPTCVCVFQKSSICLAAIHAGVIQNQSGGYVDVMVVDRRKQYGGSAQNGVTSER